MILLITLIFWVCAARGQPNGLQDPLLSEFIVRGTSVPIEQVPYQAAIIEHDDLICGGSIVSTNYVLTAGHCFADSDQTNIFKVHVGSRIWHEGGSFHNIDKIIVHEKFGFDSKGSPINDIALLHVETPFELDETVRVVELFQAGRKVLTGQLANVTGWGSTELKSNKGLKFNFVSDDLKIMTIAIVDEKECRNDYKDKYGALLDGEFCAADPQAIKDMCYGDSGGPLVINGYQAGIVSRSGPGCDLPQYPGIYTEVAYYRTWIDSHVQA